MYNTDNIRVGSIEFVEKVWNGRRLIEPVIFLDSKIKNPDGTLAEASSATYSSAVIKVKTAEYVGGALDIRNFRLSAHRGLEFWKEGQAVPKLYPPE